MHMTAFRVHCVIYYIKSRLPLHFEGNFSNIKRSHVRSCIHLGELILCFGPTICIPRRVSANKRFLQRRCGELLQKKFYNIMPTQYSRPAREKPWFSADYIKNWLREFHILFSFYFFKSNLYSIRKRIRERYYRDCAHTRNFTSNIHNNTLYMLLLYFPSGGNSICTKSTVFPSVYMYKYIASHRLHRNILSFRYAPIASAWFSNTRIYVMLLLCV